VRITNDAKQATRCRILEAARQLFAADGYHQATTRDLARAAGIATGTLFNYFPTKEAVAMTLVAESLSEAQNDFVKRRPPGTALEEQLFTLIAVSLRRLQGCRNFLQPVLETALSPVARAAASPEGEAIRLEHLELVQQLITAQQPAHNLTPLTMHLYWTLYTGILSFWVNDPSPKQEDTLALIDQSLKMFIGWIENEDQKN
jgi:AcrR family transcriptional regulator